MEILKRYKEVRKKALELDLESLKSLKEFIIFLIIVILFGGYWYLKAEVLSGAIIVVLIFALVIILLLERRKLPPLEINNKIKKEDIKITMEENETITIDGEEYVKVKKEKKKEKKEAKEDTEVKEEASKAIGDSLGLPNAKDYEGRVNEALGI